MEYVATVLTVYGIETLSIPNAIPEINLKVATVLTVYGIETMCKCVMLLRPPQRLLQQYLPFTVLKLSNTLFQPKINFQVVATVLTVYGIETR